ncbi:MAG: hypothetical protein KF752_01140 [Pirellulaceae bacterium]|nr:hypothetical protein [Pirellulaceae bacterium]
MSDQAPRDCTVFRLNPLVPSDAHAQTGPVQKQSPGGVGELPTAKLANGRFEIQQTLSRGGFAAVYRAYDLQLKRVAALTLPHGNMLGNRLRL